jgi:orotate phosphoribosyltransferase
MDFAGGSAPVTKAELGREIYRVAHLTGSFLLRSGQTSHEYFDKYRFESQPALLRAIAREMVALIPPGVQVLAGLELGGVPIATALSLETGLPAAFVRKEAKPYGTCQVAEGVALAGKKVLVVEDVITTGGQVILSANDLRALDATVEHVVCVLLRNEEAVAKLGGAGLGLTPLFRRRELGGA